MKFMITMELTSPRLVQNSLHRHTNKATSKNNTFSPRDSKWPHVLCGAGDAHSVGYRARALNEVRVCAIARLRSHRVIITRVIRLKSICTAMQQTFSIPENLYLCC